MSNESNSVLYTGMTNNLKRRIYEHKSGLNKLSFTSKYNVHKLVYYEVGESAVGAILREKSIKGGSRKKKIELIKNFNPAWDDLANVL